MKYEILVRYRTRSGCNAKAVTVQADDVTAAMRAAADKVRRMRGVIRIDGCQWANGASAYSKPYFVEEYE